MSNLRMVGALLVLAGVAGLTANAPFSAISGSPEPPPSLSYATPYREGVPPASVEAGITGNDPSAMQQRILPEAESEDPSVPEEWSEAWDWYETDEEAEG